MYDELYAPENSNALGQLVRRPQPGPAESGAFTGFGSALVDSLPYAGLTAMSGWTAILDAYGKSSAYANASTVAMLTHQQQPDLKKLEFETIGKMGDSEIAKSFRENAKKFTPDPAAVGMAGQVVHGVVGTLAKAGAYSLLTGPAAPIVFGGDMGINRAQELTDQGVDAGTAAGAGVVTGALSAAMLKLPPALGATRLQSAGIGAVINPLMGIAERGTIHALLEHADYSKIATQYKPLDPTQLAIEALTGAAFGGIFHSTKAREGATLTPDEHAAALVMNEVRTRDGDTLTRPGDMVAANAAHEAQILARGQLDAGEPVSVAHGLTLDPDAVATMRRDVGQRTVSVLIARIKTELLGTAGERAEPGQIPGAKAELDTLTQRLESLDDTFKDRAKALQGDGLSRKQAESQARKDIESERATIQASADRLDQFVTRNQSAQHAEQMLAQLERGEIPPEFMHRIQEALLHSESGLVERPITTAIRSAFEAKGNPDIAIPGVKRSPDLSPVHRVIETAAYKQILKDPSGIVEEYFRRFGNTIDPDNVKKLFQAFAKDPSLAAAVHEPSSYLAKLIYAEALKRNEGKPVVFTAGGGGSGKTEAMPIAMAAAGVKDGSLTYDSTLSSLKSAVERIDAAIATGAKVVIVYTNRHVEGAFKFAMGRERVVRAKTLAEAHVGASDTIRALAERYKDHPDVKIVVVNNHGDRTDMHLGSLDQVFKYDHNQIERRLYDLAQEAHDSGAITADRHAALLGRSSDASGRGGNQEVQPGQQGQDLRGSGQGDGRQGQGGPDGNLETPGNGQSRLKATTDAPGSPEGVAKPTPEILSARQILADNPDFVVRLEDGTDVRAADLLREADSLTEQAGKEAQGIRAAISCALRFGDTNA